MKRMVKVIDKSGRVIWANVYTDVAEMVEDLKVLLKPSTFGGTEYQLIIERV